MADHYPTNPISVTEIRAASAERYDIIFEPTERGTFVIETDIIHWVTSDVLGATRTSITVTQEKYNNNYKEREVKILRGKEEILFPFFYLKFIYSNSPNE